MPSDPEQLLAIIHSERRDNEPALAGGAAHGADESFLLQSVQRAADQVPDAALDVNTIGGNLQLIGRAEIEFPLIERVGIRAVVFADAGNELLAQAIAPVLMETAEPPSPRQLSINKE